HEREQHNNARQRSCATARSAAAEASSTTAEASAAAASASSSAAAAATKASDTATAERERTGGQQQDRKPCGEAHGHDDGEPSPPGRSLDGTRMTGVGYANETLQGWPSRRQSTRPAPDRADRARGSRDRAGHHALARSRWGTVR